MGSPGEWTALARGLDGIIPESALDRSRRTWIASGCIRGNKSLKKLDSRLVAHFDRKLKQMDDTTAFLHGELDKNIYMNQPKGSDIAYAISCLSKFMSNPDMPHWNVLKRLLRYLKTTIDVGLTFSKCSIGTKLVGYVDFNYANDRDNRKSITSYVFTLCGSCISCKSQFQPIVALSTTESEYVVATATFKEAIWLKTILSEVSFLDKNMVVFSDS
ncbi:secreted RxLR effector protein 161-like [Impatiens glandulifera]|uniref:secreted RxLR effector protein 161-like n=1 Tax=Impatiens glandulifera TaxID=253017 RepID=UPI001FB1327C|nr:secreted RxLR effector protein 161-like [Impatiens glandulifera]